MSTLVVGYSEKKLIVANTSFTSSSIYFQVELVLFSLDFVEQENL